MKNLGKKLIHIWINGVPNGRTQNKTVYENANGELFVNDLQSKKKIDIVNGAYCANYLVRSIALGNVSDE